MIHPEPASPHSEDGSRTGTLQELVAGFEGRGEAPAVIAIEGETARSLSFAELAGRARRTAAALLSLGIARGESVALIGANSPEWVVAFWGIVAAGATAMPLDPQIGEDDLCRMLDGVGCRVVFTTVAHAGRAFARDPGRRPILLDAHESIGGSGTGEAGLLPASATDDVAVLVFTSGTTGTPKAVPLTHANLLANLSGLATERLAGPGDRALLPLPLHHVYPLTVGMIVGLASGAALIFPAGLSGPQLRTALRLGRATIMIGVPRLYSALVAGIRQAAAPRHGLVSAALPALLRVCAWIAGLTGYRPGRLLFARVHRELAPDLRMMISGGAALDPDVATTLTGLGWEVLSGYGLTETAPILAFTRRGRTPRGSAGLPLPGVALRIAAHDATGQGEVQARGANVFSGYRGAAAATRTAFTADGWFRTGDLGSIDRRGFLYIAARLSETIVLPDGKKLFPEEIEEKYAGTPPIREIALLLDQGNLVGLVVPDLDAARKLGMGHLDDLVRSALQSAGRMLPSHARLTGFALSREPLPRTNLGKLRRHLLPQLYMRARSGAAVAEPAKLSEADTALLAHRDAARVWRWLAARYRGRPLALDTSPQFDLAIDSLGWVDLTLALQHDLGIMLTEARIARISTLRDLLTEAIASAGAPPERHAVPTAADLDRLVPAGVGRAAIRAALYAANRLAMRLAFKLKVEGGERLPAQGPVIVCPNHTSYLDAFAVGAAMPRAMHRRTIWGGWTGLLFARGWQREFSRVAQVIPVDAEHAPETSLDYALLALARGFNLVWFPEGGRSRDGSLQHFQPGIGVLVDRAHVPVVPVHIDGAFAAWPIGQRWPRMRKITVRFGSPIDPANLISGDDDPARFQRAADAVRDAVAALGR